MNEGALPEPLIAQVIGYAAPMERIANRPLLYIAWVMAAGPLAVGVSMVPLFAITHNVQFAIAGLGTIVWGLGAFFIGLICILVYRGTNQLRDEAMRERVLKQSRRVIWCLVMNFPAAIACAIVGGWLMNR